LVPRRPRSTEMGGPAIGATAAGGTKAGAASKVPQTQQKESKSNQKVEKYSPPPPEDIDEKLIYDAHKAATNFMNSIVNLNRNLIK
jgi:hypothetical protein